jgi:hypothetical protein
VNELISSFAGNLGGAAAIRSYEKLIKHPQTWQLPLYHIYRSNGLIILTLRLA